MIVVECMLFMNKVIFLKRFFMVSVVKSWLFFCMSIVSVWMINRSCFFLF